MTEPQPEALLDEVCRRIQELVAPYLGRVEYGNLRFTVTSWEGSDLTNIALAYETPGGSTDQINVSCYGGRSFSLVDAHAGEVTTSDPQEVLENVKARVVSIPDKRREHLYGEIRRQLDTGATTAGVVGHLNRMMNSGFKGGTMTHIEMKDAMTYAVKYMNERKGVGVGSGSQPPQ